MSTNTSVPVVVHKMINPKLNVNRPVSYAAVLGPQNIIYQKFQSQSFSNSQANINCVFNSNSLVDVATATLGVTFTINFTGTSAGAGITLLQMKGARTAAGVSAGTLNRDGPRAYPLGQVLSSLNLQIENDTPSSNVNQYINAVMRFYNDKENQDLYQCPSMLDITQNYEDLADFSAVDPLNDWVNNSTQRTRGGGGVSNLIINQNTSTGAAGDVASVTFTTYEPIYLSPFLYGADKRQQRQAKPLTGLNTLILNMTFGSQSSLGFADQLSRIWSHNPSAVGGASIFSAVNVTVNDVFLNMSYYQAPLTYPIRSGIGTHDGYSYPYSEYLLLPTLLQNVVAPNNLVTIQMNTTKLSAVPSKLFIWVGRDPSTQNFTTTDTAFAIQDGGLKITFNGQDGYLSSCTAQQLYEISKINGLVDNFSDFSRNVGSFLCLKFAQDIPLPPSLAPGCQGNFDLSMTVTAMNVNQLFSLRPQLNVLVQYEGTYSVVGTQWSRSIGPISQADVLALQSSEHGFMTYNAAEMLNGGNIFKSIGNFFKKAVNNPLVRSLGRSAWSGLNPESYAAAKVACVGNKSNFCNFVNGAALEDMGGENDDMYGYGDGVMLGGVAKKRCPKGKRKSRTTGKCNVVKRRTKSKSKSRSKVCKQKNMKARMECVRSYIGHPKRKSRSRKGRGFEGGEMLTYDDLRDLV